MGEKKWLTKRIDQVKNGLERLEKWVDEKAFEKEKEAFKEKKEKHPRRKLFFEMLLKRDVPKNEVGDIKNFKLDKNRFCFLSPWDKKSITKAIAKLQGLKILDSAKFCVFDNPVSQYIVKQITQFSEDLNKEV